MYDSSDVWEGLFIELKHIFHKSVVIGNIYRPPRDININYLTFRITTHSICFRET